LKLPSKFFLGDSLIILVSLIFIIFAFKTFWHFETGSVVQVNFQGKTYGNFSLFQDKKISLIGHEGESMIEIKMVGLVLNRLHVKINIVFSKAGLVSQGKC